MSDVLLLNMDGQPLTLWPLSTISWQQAIKAHFLGKVKILKTYDDWICRSQHLAMPMPSVVMMSRYRHHAGKVNLVPSADVAPFPLTTIIAFAGFEHSYL